MKVTFLGTGTSHGVPRIACDCAVCRSSDPHNRRLRPSVLLTFADRNVVIDTSSDFRAQLLAHPVKTLDAILFTHAHADHVHGLDDVRVFSDVQGPIDAYGSPEACRLLRQSFAYIFEAANRVSGIPKLRLHEIDRPFQLFGATVIPIPLMHGKALILGYRIGNFAYLTDCSAIPDESFDLLGGLEVLVIDGLRFRPHPTHFTIDESIEIAGILRPKRAFLTHIAHDIDHHIVSEMLPPEVFLAYDGLVLDVD
jgi:phosphoribosyl 1,2-cyclic phosphate phosphodiesterase